MKNESHYAERLGTLLERIAKRHPAEVPPARDPVVQLVLSFLEWNATQALALAAYDRLMSAMVDLNDLRVSLPHEVVAVIGETYPQAQERALRLRESLYEIFQREHATSLASLQGKAKKQVRAYLESLPGIPPYVVAQVVLLAFGGHAVPLDDRMAALLRKEGAIDAEATVEEAMGFLERQVKATDAPAMHAAMRAWVDAQGPELEVAAGQPAAPAASAKAAPDSQAASSANGEPAPKGTARKKAINPKNRPSAK